MKNYDEIIKSANDTMMQLHQIILELHNEIERLNNIINKGINECEKSAHDIWEVEGAYSNWFLEIKDILKGSEQE